MNAAQEWPKILQFDTGATITEQLVEKHYRKLAPKYHPDLGGSNEDMLQLNLSKQLALEWIAKKRREEQESAAAKQAAEQAAVIYQQVFHQQMAANQSSYFQQGLGSFGSMGQSQYGNANGWANAYNHQAHYQTATAANPLDSVIPPAPLPELSRWKKFVKSLRTFLKGAN